MIGESTSTTSDCERTALVVTGDLPQTLADDVRDWLVDANWRVRAVETADDCRLPVDIVVVHESQFAAPRAPSPRAISVRTRGHVVVVDDRSRIGHVGANVAGYLHPPLDRATFFTVLDTVEFRATYERTVSQFFDAASALASLEATADPAAVEQSEERRRLQTQIADLRAEADGALRKLDLYGSLEDILRTVPDTTSS